MEGRRDMLIAKCFLLMLIAKCQVLNAYSFTIERNIINQVSETTLINNWHLANSKQH